MKLTTLAPPALALVCLALRPVAVHAGSSESAPQEAARTPPTEPRPQVELVSARLVASIEMPRHAWLPPDPTTQMGLLLTIKLPTQSSFKSEDFKVAYAGAKGETTAVCRGYGMSMGWLIPDEEGKGWSLHTGGKVVDVPFLFVVPKEVSAITLRFRGKPVGSPVVPARDATGR